MTNNNRIVKEIHTGFHPQAGRPEPMLLQGVGRTFLAFNAISITGKGLREIAGTAILEFEQCLAVKSTDPGWGVFSEYPIARSLNLCEIEGSSWLETVKGQNLGNDSGKSDCAGARHFIACFHDRAFEFLAGGFAAKLDLRPKREVLEALVNRLRDR